MGAVPNEASQEEQLTQSHLHVHSPGVDSGLQNRANLHWQRRAPTPSNEVGRALRFQMANWRGILWALKSGFLHWQKWLVSCSSPSQPTKRHSLKLFRCQNGRLWVIYQWFTGARNWRGQRERKRRSHLSRNARCSFVSSSSWSVSSRPACKNRRSR